MTNNQPISALRRQLIAASLTGLAVPTVLAQDRAVRNLQIYMYKGADREARLLEGAKKEGVVNIYTSLNTKDSGPITEVFEKKYGVKTLLWRASSEKVLQRVVTESRAGRYQCDVLETNGPEMEAMYREKLLAEFHSPHFAELAPAAFPKHRHYVATRFNFFTIGYNTNLVKPAEVPNTYQDLLHPRFVGKLGLEAGDTDWFAALVKHMGEEKGPGFLPQARRIQTADAHRAYAAGRTGVFGRDPDHRDDLQPQHGTSGGEGCAGQVEGPGADFCPPQRDRGRRPRHQPARRYAVHRLPALARRPNAAQGAQSCAVEPDGRLAAQQVPL